YSLRARGFRGRDTHAELIFHFTSNQGFMARPSASVSVRTDPSLGGSATVAMSTDGVNWPVSGSSSAGEENIVVSTEGREEFARGHDVWVRMTLSGGPGTSAY